jgi:hypothetical protein
LRTRHHNESRVERSRSLLANTNFYDNRVSRASVISSASHQTNNLDTHLSQSNLNEILDPSPPTYKEEFDKSFNELPKYEDLK